MTSSSPGGFESATFSARYIPPAQKWKIWWRAALIRAVKTLAQTALATIGTAAVLSQVNWVAVLSASLLAALLSLLTSLAGLPELK